MTALGELVTYPNPLEAEIARLLDQVEQLTAQRVEAELERDSEKTIAASLRESLASTRLARNGERARADRAEAMAGWLLEHHARSVNGRLYWLEGSGPVLPLRTRSVPHDGTAAGRLRAVEIAIAAGEIGPEPESRATPE